MLRVIIGKNANDVGLGGGGRDDGDDEESYGKQRHLSLNKNVPHDFSSS